MSDPREPSLNVHLHVYRQNDRGYPELHLHVHERAEPDAAGRRGAGFGGKSPCVMTPHQVITPLVGQLTWTRRVDSATGVICARGAVRDSSFLCAKVCGKVYHSESEIPTDPHEVPSDAVCSELIDDERYEISEIGNVLLGTGQENYCVLWPVDISDESKHRRVVNFIPEESDYTECEGTSRPAALAPTCIEQIQDPASFPAAYVLSSDSADSGGLLSNEVVLQCVSVGAEWPSAEWSSEGSVQWRLRIIPADAGYTAELLLKSVLGAPLSQPLVWRCQRWASFGVNRLVRVGATESCQCGQVLLVKPA